MLWIDPSGEGVVELRVLQAALVMRSREREERGFTAGELVNRRSSLHLGSTTSYFE